jgi:large subunit ribosomal protein L1
MGKIRTRTLGLEDLEEAQKETQKKKAQEKKMVKKDDEKEVVESEPAEKAPKKEKAEVKTASKRVIGKKHQKALKSAEKGKAYTFAEAIAILKKIKYTKFDESVELHMNLTKEGLRGEIELPHSTGKTVRVAIVDDKLIDNLSDGKIEFDILISHPSFMPKLAKYARVLGPKGLMPNPKTGTISMNPEEVAKKFQKGLLKWKSEPKFPLLHQMIAKISQDDKEIQANAEAFIEAVGRSNIKAVFIKTTMSPGFQIGL